jgi:hypothetical protein
MADEKPTWRGRRQYLPLATGSKALAVEDGSFFVEVGTGLVQEHR